MIHPFYNHIVTRSQIVDKIIFIYEITKGKMPSVEPFAIFPKRIISNFVNEFQIIEQVEREGVILMNWDATNFVWNLLPKEWKEQIRNHR